MWIGRDLSWLLSPYTHGEPGQTMLETCKGIPWGGTTLALVYIEAETTPKKLAFSERDHQTREFFCLEPETPFNGDFETIEFQETLVLQEVGVVVTPGLHGSGVNMRKRVINYAGSAFDIQAPLEPWHGELDVLYAADDKAVGKLLPSENANEESAFCVSLIFCLHLCTAC